ncbi:MAG: zinc-binding alcohol dehydrogenase [Desulfomonile sp.]|nr:zinc-binding alcohol dehydrogenase [Desulfomonile sp.]
MNRLVVRFTAPYGIAVEQEPLPALPSDSVLVQTIASAISPGTELLVYRGKWPAGIAVDASITSLAGEFAYPLKYGYSCVGRVIDLGSEVPRHWLDAMVFAFNPHESHFIADPASLIPVPAGLSPDSAAMLPNMETAVNLLMDGRPVIGDRVVVFGQGVVGLLTTALLSRMPLSGLVALDHFPLRRMRAVEMGARTAFDPQSPDLFNLIKECFDGGPADLTYELSGNPAALDQAISATGFNGRVVVGSWYGAKKAEIDLGGYFHRSRISIVSSQVSTLAPEFTGRWTTTRRLQLAMSMVENIRPTGLVTHRLPVNRAAEAFALLDQHPEDAIQVILSYEDV